MKQENRKINVLFTAFEADPFFKSGGLGDVAGTLPAYINSTKYDVRLVLPKLSQIPAKYQKKMEFLESYGVPLAWRNEHCGLFRLKSAKLTVYFLDNEYYFKRSKPYGEFDDGERMAFFSKAVLETIQHIPDFKPDIIHANDWHTALVPVYLREQYNHIPEYNRIKTLFTVHNLKFQGMYSEDIISDVLGLKDTPAEPQLRIGHACNFMKAALLYSDKLSTVSPSYADEVCTGYFGEMMDGIFRRRKSDFTGILNGLDYKIFDPERDPLIYANYSAKDIKNKKENKLRLQKDLGLEVNPDIPIFAIISRLTEQKGLDLVTYNLPRFMDRNMQFVVLGVGDEKYEEAFRWYENKFKGRVCSYIAFDNALSHRIYAGADVIMLPSRFEPCGLNQLIAMRYGSLPLVRETGGLKDSVECYNKYTKEGSGFSFANYNAEELLDCVDMALECYADKKAWKQLQLNAMNQDYSWKSAARDYRKLYRSML